MKPTVDLSFLGMPIVQNQAYLRTILHTQARILAKLEERDVKEVQEQLLDRVIQEGKLVVKALNKRFPDDFIFIDSD